jgi:hypothetical protein
VHTEKDDIAELTDPTANDGIGIAWQDHEIISHRRKPTWNRPSIILNCLALLIVGMLGAFVIEISIPVAPNHGLVEALEKPIPPLPNLDGTLSDNVSPPIVDTPRPVANERAQRSLVRKPVPSKVERVISFALSQQGKPYRWNQTGPRGYDCSGLVVASFRAIGIKLPHYTGDLRKLGIRISRGTMVRGDLIFPASNHVGIYLGGNKMVVASSGKGKVIIQTVYAFYTARRVI